MCAPLLGLAIYLHSLGVTSGSLLDYMILCLSLIIIGILILLPSYVAHEVTKRRVFESKSFLQSFDETFVTMRFYLSQLPVVGGWFTPKADGK